MKKGKLILCSSITALVVASAVIFGIVSGDVTAAGNKPWYESEPKTDAYVFPEDNSENPLSHNESVDFYNVPDDILSKISTEGLVETCLTYPMFGLIFADNTSVYNGLQQQLGNFNGLRELLKREDSASVLLDVYENLNIENKIEADDEFFLMRVMYFEYIISQEEIISKLSEQERQRLREVSVKNIKYKNSSDDHSLFSTNASYLIIARLLSVDNADFSEYAANNSVASVFLSQGVLVGEQQEIDEFLEYIL